MWSPRFRANSRSKNSRDPSLKLTTAMKSVGEVMAIGRSFHESVQKALASMETDLTGFDDIAIEGAPDKSASGYCGFIKSDAGSP